jgi:hypothetical protein
VVEGEVEGVEVAQAALSAGPGPPGASTIKRHLLLRDAAVRAQRRVEAGEVVRSPRVPSTLVALGHHDDVADAVARQARSGGTPRRLPSSTVCDTMPGTAGEGRNRRRRGLRTRRQVDVANEPSAPWWTT